MESGLNINILYVALTLTALGGFFLSLFIHHKKSSGQKMACPFDSDCNAVIHSQYSNFLHCPIEIIGIVYYGLITMAYSLLLAFPTLASPIISLYILVVTAMAFLFSLYLTFIQTVTLKQWCAYCLTSAGLCAVIFSIAIIPYGKFALFYVYFGIFAVAVVSNKFVKRILVRE